MEGIIRKVFENGAVYGGSPYKVGLGPVKLNSSQLEAAIDLGKRLYEGFRELDYQDERLLVGLLLVA